MQITESHLRDKHRVRNHWDILTGGADVKIKAILYSKVIQYWVGMRGKAIAKAWVDGHKKGGQASVQGEHSLRKELK